MEPLTAGVVGVSMKLKSILVLSTLLLVVGSSTAAAKYASHSLTVDGPRMGSPGVIRERRSIDRVSVAMLVGTDRIRVERPRSTGPAYLLEYAFGVGDEDGSRTETIRQSIYPFAVSGPVVLTPSRQKIDLSYGPVRFAPGWFEVPRWVMQKLEGLGLPHAPPEPGPASAAPVSLDPPSPIGRWVVGLALLTVGAAVVAAFRRRSLA
jgi:hypothetical protein